MVAIVEADPGRVGIVEAGQGWYSGSWAGLV